MQVDIDKVCDYLRHWAEECDRRPDDGPIKATALYEAAREFECLFPKCSECGGSGEKAYGSTATFTGGIGGQMITNSVCDKCWGSGDSKNPGKNLKEI